MARTKGSTNQQKTPEIVLISEEQRVALIADLIVQIIHEESEAT